MTSFRSMRGILFWAFLIIFFATAILTISYLSGWVKVPERYSDVLVGTFVLQVGGVLIALAKELFGTHTSRLEVVLVPREMFPRNGIDYQCCVEILDNEGKDIRTELPPVFHANGHLTTTLNELTEGEMLRVTINDQNGRRWQSEYFGALTMKADMEVVG